MALILVVDDRPANRDLMSTILGYQRHQVLEAGDGAAALSLLDTHQPDLIISDILMPSMDGFEFVRRLRARPSAADIPVIFSSAHYLTAEAKALAATCGVWHILPKPIEPEDLIRLTHEILSAGENTATPTSPAPPPVAGAETFGEAHLRLLTDQLAEHNRALTMANERLEAEVTVRRQAEIRYRAVVDTAADAIVVIDETGIVKSYNKAAEQIFDYTGSEVIGQNLAMLMPEPYHSAHDAFIARYKKTGERRVIGLDRVFEGRRKDGSVFPMELAVAEWADNGSRYFTGIMRDITQRREAETALKAAKDEAVQATAEAELARAEAERADLAKSKFLAAVSHDLRQPAQAMVLFTQIVVEALHRHPQEEAAQHLEHALSGLTKMLDVLLDVSKLDAGCVVPRPVPLSLREIIQPLAKEYGLRANRQGLRVKVVPSTATTISDPALLERILRNLIENALTYTPSGAILIGCRRRGERVRVDVIDTGIGIADDTVNLIFEEFFQVGNPERDRTKGLGLGLAIVKRLGRLLGHPIEVASLPGRGTRVSLFLPAVAAAPAPVAAPARVTVTPCPPARTILIIDDEPLIRSGLSCILESWGYRVIAAESGAEAVTAVTADGTVPDAIIADYRLRQGETGLDAIRLVVGRMERIVPSLVLTGDTAIDIIAIVRAAGFPLLHKPLSTGALQSALTNLLARP